MLYFLLSFVYSVEVRDSMGKIVLFFFLVPSLLLGKAMAEYSINSNYLISGNVNSTTFKVHKTRDQALTGAIKLKSPAYCTGFDRKGNVYFVVDDKKKKGFVMLSFTKSGLFRFGSRQPSPCKRIHGLSRYDAIIIEGPLGSLMFIDGNSGQIIRQEVTQDMRNGARSKTAFKITPAGNKFAWIEPQTHQRSRDQWFSEIQFRELSSGKLIQKCRLPRYYENMYFSKGANYVYAYRHLVSAVNELDRHQLLVFESLSCKLVKSYPLQQIFPAIGKLKLWQNLQLEPVAIQPTYQIWQGSPFPIFSFLPQDPAINWLMRDQSLRCMEELSCNINGPYQNARLSVSPDGRHYAIYLPHKAMWFKTNPDKFFKLFGGYPELAFEKGNK